MPHHYEDLLRTPPFFPEERKRDVGRPRGKRKREEVKGGEKGDGFLRKLMTGVQGFAQGGVPGAYFSVADYDANKKWRQQQASLEMQQAMAGIESELALGDQRRGAGTSSRATADATGRGADRNDQLQPGAMETQRLENAGQSTDNAMEEFKRANQQEKFDADISQTKGQARQMSSQADRTQKQIEEMAERLAIAKQNADSGTATAGAAQRRADTGEEGQAVRAQASTVLRRVNELIAAGEKATREGNPEKAADAFRMADEAIGWLNKMRPKSAMDNMMDAHFMMQQGAGGFLDSQQQGGGAR